MYDVSIILPTCDRGPLLERALDAVAAGTTCNYELIVVDGASIDSTPAVLTEAAVDMGPRLKVIRETRREGFVKAANKGFAAATGRNVMWLNDDARPLPGSIDSAIEQLDAAGDEVAILALFHRFALPRNVAYETTRDDVRYSLLHVRGTLYANFGLLRRQTMIDLGYFDERYFINGADPDLSLKAWHSGRRVAPAYGCLIDHDEHDDGRRHIDLPRGEDDNARLFAKWNLPPKNPMRNDFDPARPCTLLGLRNQFEAIAA